ncbi:MAG: phosphoribosylformylglycinamidine synthase subunit PurS [Deltaproteobacteria bacterium]|nr:phosphoribosylformylglycinamidine synthase subunit PurS [Deltaproteobacteria bacterium]
MVFRIEVAYKEGIRDVLGEKIRRSLVRNFGFDIHKVTIVDVYTIDADIPEWVIERLKIDGFCDPVIQSSYVNEPCPIVGDWAIEVGFKPGVTDNVGRTAKEVIEAVSNYNFKFTEGVYTSRLYMIWGNLKEDEVKKIAEEALANVLIQNYRYKDRKRYIDEKGMGTLVPKPKGGTSMVVETFSLKMGIDSWMRLSKERTWALSEEEIRAIISYYKRNDVKEERRRIGLSEDPTDVEIEAIAQTWSEHCKHKIFNATIEYEQDGQKETINSIFKTFIVRATEEIRNKKGKRDFCLSVFTDNAGVISFNRKYNLAFKVETHNTPSALDPYGGALTGIVGVNRDPFGTGKGSKLIFNTDVFCFAPPDFEGKIPPRLFHPKRVLEGVREGVEHGGNKSGIPTVNGSITFHERFLGKPLVFCGTCGVMPKKIRGEPSYLKGAKRGDLIVMVGGRIGKDGIHGATFSSEELSESSPTSAVQIGDPITQKRMTDFLLLARDKGLYNSITDCGAGGLSSSVGEMARDTNGCVIYLDKPPLKYEGLSPWEILLSEAQERMTLAVPPQKIDAFMSLSKKMGVESTVIGEFTDTGKFHCLYRNQTVAYIDMDFLHNGLPKMILKAKWERKISEGDIPIEPTDYNQVLLDVLKRWNVCSKEYVVRQYDHEVQAQTIIKPLVGNENDGPSDASVLKPDPESNEAIVISHGICPKFSEFDTYHMAACAITEAIANNLAVGGTLKKMALLDNFCWPDPVESERNPDGSYKLAQLVRAAKALYDFAKLYGTPFISGKDSMKNDYVYGDIKISIPPTVLISALSIIDDPYKVVTMDFKEPESLIVIIGLTFPELGGSEYFGLFKKSGGIFPKVRGRLAKKIFLKLDKATNKRLFLSCHDVSDGGLACALAECAFSGGLGAEVDLSKVPVINVYTNDYILFSESANRFVVTVRERDFRAFEALFNGLPYNVVGKVRKDDRFVIKGIDGKVIINIDLKSLKDAWKSPFMAHFG